MSEKDLILDYLTDLLADLEAPQVVPWGFSSNPDADEARHAGKIDIIEDVISEIKGMLK